jgi:L-methionine (R)-S-oxide reductase
VDPELETLVESIGALFEGECDFIANAGNASAAIATGMDGVNWAGVYLLRGGELVLGPFCGKPACTRIALGKGVCGTAAARAETVVVDDVTAFPGHIACDPVSASEIVVPLARPSGLIGVLDVDSSRKGRFGPDERAALERVAALLLEASGPAR